MPTAGAAQTIPLQHTVPGDILKLMHWDQAAHLPEGVTQISSRPETNSLAVVATPDGFAKVKELVRILDFVPRQVQIRAAFAYATEAGLKASGITFDLVPLTAPRPEGVSDPVFIMYATGSSAAGLQKTLAKQGSAIPAPVMTTTNNAAASITVSTQFRSQVISSVTLAVRPRINSDNSVTLDLHPVFVDGSVKREIKTLRTAKDGETMVIVMPSHAAGAGRRNLLLFVTPMVVPTEADTPTKPIK